MPDLFLDKTHTLVFIQCISDVWSDLLGAIIAFYGILISLLNAF